MFLTKKVKKTILTASMLAIVGLSLSSCATTPSNPDPYKNYNKAMFEVNDKIYNYALMPIADIYVKYIPNFIKDGITNFFSNFNEPTRIINDMLQNQWKWAGQDTSRFLINSTIGIGGLFNPANNWFDLKVRQGQSFGITLYKWGYYNSESIPPYIILPLLGPSNSDALVGFIVDNATNPLTYASFLHSAGPALLTSLNAVDSINKMAPYILQYEKLKSENVTPYIALRTMYTQNRNHTIQKLTDINLKKTIDIKSLINS